MENLDNLRQSLSSDITTDVTTNISDIITRQLADMFSWIVLPSIIIALAIFAIYVFRSIRRYRLEKAIFEIRDLLRDIKQLQTPRADPVAQQNDIVQTQSTPSDEQPT